MHTHKLKKIVWAVDVLDENQDHKNALFLLGALSRSSGAIVHPVCVLAPPYASFSEGDESQLEPAFQALAEKRMASFAKGYDLPTLDSGRVLINRSGSLVGDVRALIQHAQKENADVIVVATQSRRGLARMFIGSFAESLALLSPIPVITVNPATQIREKIAKILVPTTFQPGLRADFERVASLAKTLDAELILYFKPTEIPPQYKTPAMERHILSETALRNERAAEWKSYAAGLGVKVQLQLDSQPGSLIPAIEALVIEQDIDLIAMTSQMEPVQTFLAGSNTRKLIRVATCPVWTIKIKSATIGEPGDWN